VQQHFDARERVAPRVPGPGGGWFGRDDDRDALDLPRRHRQPAGRAA
jgi:hypothetical protein